MYISDGPTTRTNPEKQTSHSPEPVAEPEGPGASDQEMNTEKCSASRKFMHVYVFMNYNSLPCITTAVSGMKYQKKNMALSHLRNKITLIIFMFVSKQHPIFQRPLKRKR